MKDLLVKASPVKKRTNASTTALVVRVQMPADVRGALLRTSALTIINRA